MITEETLIPSLLSQIWPELIFVKNGASTRYGFMYHKDYADHGKAILRLSSGYIIIINQNEDNYSRSRSEVHAPTDLLPGEILVSISDPNIKKYKSIVSKRIRQWKKDHMNCRVCRGQVI